MHKDIFYVNHLKITPSKSSSLVSPPPLPLLSHLSSYHQFEILILLIENKYSMRKMRKILKFSFLYDKAKNLKKY